MPSPRISDRRAQPSTGSLMAVPIAREERRVTNQRSEDQLRGVIDQTIIHFRRRKHIVSVINVSSRGAMIDADIDARIGETIELQLAKDNRTKCAVRWIRDGRIGMEFVNETIVWDCFRADEPSAPAPKPADEPEDGHAKAERPPRHALMRMGSLLWNGLTLPVRLRDISSKGAKLESGRNFLPGAEIELNLGDAGLVYAEVRWSKDGQVGLRFADEFDMESLAPKLEASPATKMLKPQYLETETSEDSPWAARFESLSFTDLRPTGPR